MTIKTLSEMTPSELYRNGETTFVVGFASSLVTMGLAATTFFRADPDFALYSIVPAAVAGISIGHLKAINEELYRKTVQVEDVPSS